MDANSTFADRLWWARNRRGVGANTLAEQTGCAQSLISGLERANAKGSEYNNKFAAALGVDSHWLAHGTGTVPEGFDAEDARSGREGMRKGKYARNIRLASDTTAPAWAASSPMSKLSEEASLTKKILSDFQDLIRIIGPERTPQLIEHLEHLAALIHGQQSAKRED